MDKKELKKASKENYLLNLIDHLEEIIDMDDATCEQVERELCSNLE